MDYVTAIRRNMERDTGPLGQRLLAAFSEMIDAGLVPAGKALPSERDLAEALGVSRSTLRDCLSELCERRLVRTKRGVGTIVVGQVRKALSRLSGFTEDMRARGIEPSSRVLERKIGPATPEIAIRTGLPLGTRIMTVARLRYAGGEVLSFERVNVPLVVVGADYDGTTSLYS